MAVILTAGSTGALITNGGLTIQSNQPWATVGDVVARGSTLKTTGKYAFEVHRTCPFFTHTEVGFTNQNTPNPATALGNATIDVNGFVYVNGIFKGTAAVQSEPTPTTILVDLDNALLWIGAIDPLGWNDGSVGDWPCDPTKYGFAFDISSIMGSGLYPFVRVSKQSFIIDPTASSIVTFNFGAVAIHKPLPGCVTGTWDTLTPPPTPTLSARINARMPAFRSALIGKAAPAPVQIRTASSSREPNDVTAAHIANTQGVTGAVTEAADTGAGHMTRVLPAVLDDGEIIYVPADYGLRVPADPSSPFVIPFEDTLLVVPLLDV